MDTEVVRAGAGLTSAVRAATAAPKIDVDPPMQAAMRRWAIVPLVVRGLVVAALLAGVLHLHRDPTAVPIPAPRAAADDTLRPAVVGAWRAVGIVRSSQGTDQPVGKRIERRWVVDKRCPRSGCGFYVTRETADVWLTARLTAAADGWHARFPPQHEPCGREPSGAIAYWDNITDFVFRFSADGRAIDAGERNASRSPVCGWGVSTLTWHATPAAA